MNIQQNMDDLLGILRDKQTNMQKSLLPFIMEHPKTSRTNNKNWAYPFNTIGVFYLDIPETRVEKRQEEKINLYAKKSTIPYTYNGTSQNI